MRALVTRLGPDRRREKVLVTDWPEVEAPVANQIKTQTIYTGITNGTERNDLLGGNYASNEDALPAISGYQNVGRVVALGPEVSGLSVGDLAYIGSGKGVGGKSAGHVEFIVIAEDRLLTKLPDTVDPIHAALFGMGSVAMRCCRNADLRTGERLLIVGGGGCVGQLAAQIATVMGARVTICDVDRRRLDLARETGAADEILDVAGDGWDQKINDGAYDAVIDLAGLPGMEDKLITAVRPRGRVLLISGRWKVNYTFNLGQRREVTIKQNNHFDREDLENLCRMVSRGWVRIGPLVQDVVPVAESDRIYRVLRDEPLRLMGTVFVW